MTLIQQLVKKGILEKAKAASLDYEIKNSGRKEEEVILERKIVSEELLFGLKSESQNVPFKRIYIEEVPLKTLELIPEDSARFYNMIPIGLKDNNLEIGMVYPEDLKAQEAIKFLARQGKFDYKVFLITLSDFRELFKKYRTLRREVGRALEELETEMKTEKIERRPFGVKEMERLVEDAPISKVVGVILRHAVDGGASDIHIEPTRDRLRIRFRVLGVLHSSLILPLKVHPAVIARIKILTNLKLDENRIPQDGRFSAKIDEKDIDFRVSTFPTTLGEKAAIRVLDPTTGLKSFEELGLNKRNLEVIKKAIKKPYGMILSTGPTGCGKTTTLYAILKILNREEVNVMTLEDPVEYYIEGVNQSEVKPEIGYDFARGLRHLLRQDPNIIMVGEIRDNETAVLAIHAALTGHLVLSTIHTNNATGVIPRLIDLGIKPYLISPVLSVVIAQRLVRTLCQYCRTKIKPQKEVEDMILKEVANFPEFLKTSLQNPGGFHRKEIKIPKPLYIYQAVGCKKCNEEGYSGRSGVFEVLTMTDELAEIILKEPSESKINEEAKRQGMLTMKQDGILKVLDGVATIEDVLGAAEEK
ncbi:GspE/PulE family protein [Patescibacteria group bacterium]|nr:GspE/PulE family protein [Patescibacteria group bacterium]